MSVGYPISDSDGVGTSVSDMRQIVSSHWASFGVVTGCAVSTVSTGLTYKVAAGVAVASRGTTYGAVEFLVPASTVTTDAGPSSGSRYDVVYAKPQDPSQGDSTADVVVGVVKGTAAASPSKPSIPTGAVELRTFLVPQAATKTSQATVAGTVGYAIPYGASLGVWPRIVDSTNGAVSTAQTTKGNTQIVLPTDRAVEASLTVTADGTGVALFDFMLDGQLYTSRKVTLTSNWQIFEVRTVMELEAGSHTLAYRRTVQTGTMTQHYGLDAGIAYPGTVFRIRDLGVVQ